MQESRKSEDPHTLKEELIELLKELRDAIKGSKGKRGT